MDICGKHHPNYAIDCSHCEIVGRPTEKKSPPAVDEKEAVALLSHFEEPTEDEILYWSTPYWDEIQELKNKKKENLDG